MIATSAEYKDAIIADSRKTLIKATVNLIDPDISYGVPTSSGESDYSQIEQIYDLVLSAPRPHETLEHNRWILNGAASFAPPSAGVQVGFESDDVSDADCACDFWVQENFSGVGVLQACAVYFPSDEYDSYPVDFVVDILDGNGVAYSESFSGNVARVIKMDGFTVNAPVAIKVSVSKMSLPSRRLRIFEIVAGYYEVWTNDDLAGLVINDKIDPANIGIPYGTCAITIDNSDKKFTPRNKSGLFQSLEDRQSLDVFIGIDGAEYIPCGKYYHYTGGWNTAADGLTIAWNLVDIIGLLADRKYLPNGALPTTLEGWIASVVGQLGGNFASRYMLDGVDGTLAMSITADAIADATCGDILKWICQRACCYMRADAETGNLTLINALGIEGNEYALDNLSRYPVERANNDVANIAITLPNESVIVVAGNNAASPNVIDIRNPFITTEAVARDAAAWILQFYGGNLIEATGRGNPSTELGDLAIFEFDGNETEQGYVISQRLNFQNGVMRVCQTVAIEVNE